MSTYNNKRFTPGQKSNLRLFFNKLLLQQYHNIPFENNISGESLCGCVLQTTNKVKQGWNDPSQTENRRIAQTLTGTLGGKTTFGNGNKPAIINYTGGWEGQPGGTRAPPRNTF